mgnify:FL=1
MVLEHHAGALCAADIVVLEQMLRESRTWALSDSLAASVVGPLVEREPSLVTTLDRWSTDEDFWLRRAPGVRCHLPRSGQAVGRRPARCAAGCPLRSIPEADATQG